MASSFNFGFDGEDIEGDNSDADVSAVVSTSPHASAEPSAIKPSKHRLEDLVG
jgi:hypothetical protein